MSPNTKEASVNKEAPVPKSVTPLLSGDASLLQHVRRFVAVGSLADSAESLANALLARFACAHVVVGLSQPAAPKIIGWSGGTQPDAALGTARAMRDAMDEALQQHAVLRFPAASGDRPYILLRHAELARQGLGGALCTVPMPWAKGVCGAITLVRDAAAPWSDRERGELMQLAQALGPLLRLKALAEDSAIMDFGAVVCKPSPECAATCAPSVPGCALPAKPG